ncbi:enoyl-CoA hydratase/isomerase family protein [Actinocorallia libanotica]|uniref:Enoyl-CoA hydratase/isomerase family protein n=1 Tax=Actinocorallia libanotica TaxID=46162 RepID=A0ABP4C4J1_9ACTN
MSRYQTLKYEEFGPVARVTLHRPEVHNAFDMQMIKEVHACWRELRANDGIRAIVLTGAGDKSFCTGLDRTAAAVGEDDRTPELGQQGATPMHQNEPGDWLMPKTAADLWKPIIGAVNGMACGGAFYLLGEVEFMIAAEHATFFDPHTTYGMATVYESMMMAQRMPLGEVMRMSLMGSYERMSARRAHQIGLVQEVVPAEELQEKALELAQTIASQPTLALQGTVRSIWYTRELAYRQALAVGDTLVQASLSEETLSEGQEVFKSGRRVEWKLR